MSDALLESLLGRPPLQVAPEDLKELHGKRVLVTGAGGSIGQELVRVLLGCRLQHLTLVDLSEFNLYAVDQAVAEDARMTGRWTSLVADVRHPWSMMQVFKAQRPEIVFHAAALKHVPLMEVPHNAIEAVRTNVIGTANVLTQCEDTGVRRFVLVSTDKAVNPTNVMGATKRAAEVYVRMAAAQTRVSVVRFGNVLGSSGSVVPLFERQLAAGGPVTVTHPEVTRFFMTIAEAAGLVVRAATLRTGDLFVLDMGRPIAIHDLARRMIERSGQPASIVFTGLRPGEKLHEELWYPDETVRRTTVKGLLRIEAVPSVIPIEWFDRLRFHAEERHHRALIDTLHMLVPQYRELPAGAAA